MFAEAEFQADWDKVKAEYGDQAKPTMVERTANQRRADALFAVFMAAVEDDAHTLPGPLVNLVCDLQTFEEHLTRVAGGSGTSHTTNATDSGDRAHSDVGHREDEDPSAVVVKTFGAMSAGWPVAKGAGFGLRRCETIEGAPVDPGDVFAAALIGHVRRVVVNRAGVVVDAGRRTRLFRGVPRELAWLAGTTCCWPGCGHRRGVQVDHMDEFAGRDGPTDQANADPLDGFHNRFKTNHGYRVTRDDRGLLHLWRPDGTEIRPT